MIAAFAKLSPVTRGVLWMTGAALFFSITFGVVRQVSGEMNSWEITFFRGLFGVCFMLPWLIRAGIRSLQTSRPGIYGLRSAVLYTGIVCWFYGLSNMGLAEATALYFTTPLFTVLIAKAWLGEPIGPRRWAALLVGFAGALIIIRPGFVELSIPAMAVLASSLLFGVTNTTTRSLALTEKPNAMVIYAMALQLPLAIGPALYDWSHAPWSIYPWLILLGILTVISGQCLARAYGSAPISAVMPPYFLQLPFVAVIGYLAFDQTPDIWVWVGGVIICASAYFAARRETRESPS
jgi:drug/metabolite transporter (DMT)-like permease